VRARSKPPGIASALARMAQRSPAIAEDSQPGRTPYLSSLVATERGHRASVASRFVSMQKSNSPSVACLLEDVFFYEERAFQSIRMDWSRADLCVASAHGTSSTPVRVRAG